MSIVAFCQLCNRRIYDDDDYDDVVISIVALYCCTVLSCVVVALYCRTVLSCVVVALYCRTVLSCVVVALYLSLIHI